MEATADRITRLFTRYRQFISNNEGESIATQIFRVQKLFSAYSALKPELDNINKSEAEYFNIFRIMKLGHLEVRAHTPVLAHLLDPGGTHAQGALFYKLFIEMILKEKQFQDYDPSKIEVRTEFSTDFGQLDIIIVHNHSRNPYAIVIENKIYAVDQNEQLLRYKKYLDSLKHIPASSKKMIYLKPRQALPSEYSVDPLTLNEWKKTGFLHLISYKEDILSWLWAGLHHIKANKVKVLVEQYIQLLQMICHE